MHRDDITRRRLHAADDLALWYEAIAELAARARRDGDRGTEMLSLAVGDGLLALADHLLFIETAPRPATSTSAKPQQGPGA